MNPVYVSVVNSWTKRKKSRRIEAMSIKTRKIRLSIKNKSISIDYGEPYVDGINIKGNFKDISIKVKHTGDIHREVDRAEPRPYNLIIVYDSTTGSFLAEHETSEEYNIRKAFNMFGDYNLCDEVDSIEEFDDAENYAFINGNIAPICACNENKYWFDECDCTVKNVKELIDRFNAMKKNGMQYIKYEKVNELVAYAAEDYFKSKAFIMDLIGHHHEYRIKGFDPTTYKFTENIKRMIGCPFNKDIDDLWWGDVCVENITSKALNYFYKMYYIVETYEDKQTFIHQKYKNIDIPWEVISEVDAYMVGCLNRGFDRNDAIKNFLKRDDTFSIE